MAKLSSDGKYVTVQKGDTLSEIARDYGNGKTYKQLAAINNISNPNYISVGQKIYLDSSSGSSGSSGTTSTKKPTNVAVITGYGLQSNSDNTLFVTWKWTKDKTENYEVQWLYYTGDKTDDSKNVWFTGSKTTTEDKLSTYDIPSNAKSVKFRVKPVSKKYTKNDKETSYWTANWCSYIYFPISDFPPEVPSTPNVEIDKYKLTASLDNISVDAKQIEFQIVKNDKKVVKTGTATIRTKSAAYTCTVDAGGKYKVRCRAVQGDLKSDWSEYSSSVKSAPAAPKSIKKIKALSETSVQIDWENVSTAEQYEVEYTTDKTYFGSSDEVQSKTYDADVTGHAEITGLESGKEYFFRVRSIIGTEHSAWCEIKSIVIGKVPSAPTTWSSTTTATTGDPLNLYWVHNTQDNSSQTKAQIELIVNDTKKTHTITAKSNYESDEIKYIAPTDLEDGEVVTSVVSFDTKEHIEGTKIQWRVRTAGITEKYGDWSIRRTVDVYTPPALELEILNNYPDGESLEIIESLPFIISANATPNTQAPIGYHINITSDEYYETVDEIGNLKVVNAGDSVYSKYFDISGPLIAGFWAPKINVDVGDAIVCHIDLHSDVTYTVTCTVAMNSGLTADASKKIDVAWVDQEYEPNADISIDPNAVTADIRPYCENTTMTMYKVDHSSDDYVLTTEVIESSIYGEPLEGIVTTTGEQVFSGVTADGEELYYCEVEKKTLFENFSLYVYRREFDGSFTEIGYSLNNITTITDPHPALDYARYRIVAIDNNTGAVSYTDLPAYPVGEKAVIIQWAEDWSTYDVDNEDALEQPNWTGSLLRLPYNIDVSNEYNADVTHINYIGRKHPVSYYGTHLGETATWNVAIPKNDQDTIYALRRLAVWMGDVYVREPSGVGYWATISVSMPRKHLDLTIPVTLNITRVEGGI